MPDDMHTRDAGEVPTTAITDQHEDYDAFISYSHAADGSLAPALQNGLEMLAKPLYQRRAVRVFRDQTNLAATPELWSTIEQALAASRFFILLASPAAARSPWVQQELDWWRRHRAPERLLIGLTHGTIAWDPVARDFDWHTTDALPQSLSKCFPAEPLWVDLRWTSSKSALTHRDPRLQEDLATFAAPLRGMSKDDLIGRDLRMHRRVVRLTATAMSVLLALSIATGLGAWVALQQRHAAQRQATIAESRALAAAAISTAPTQQDLALLLAQRAVRMNPTAGTLASLFQAVSTSPQLVRFIPQRSPVTALIARPDGGMVVGNANGTVSLVNSAHARQQPLPATGSAPVRALYDSESANMLVSGDAQGTVRLWSLSSRSLRWRRTLTTPVEAIAVSPNALTIAAVLQNNTVVVLDAINGRMRHTVALGPAIDGQYEDHVGFLGEDTVLVGDVTGATQTWRLAPRPRRLREHIQQAPADTPASDAWSSDGRSYAFAVGGTAYVSHAATGQAGSTFNSLPTSTDAVAIDDSTNQLAYVSDSGLAVRDRSTAASKTRRTSIKLPGFATAQQLTFSADGRWLLAGGEDTVAIFDLRQRSDLATALPTQVAPLLCQACITSLTVDPRGRTVVWTDGSGLVCYDLRRAYRKKYPHAIPDGQGEVAFTPDGSTLLSYDENYLGIWSTSAGCPSSVRLVRIGYNSASQLLPVDNNQVVVTSASRSIRLLDLPQGRVVREYLLPKSTELSWAATSSDDRSLAVSLTNGNIVWFHIGSGTPLATKGSGSGRLSEITFLPHSEVVAQTSPTATVLWDPHRGQVGRFEGSAQDLTFSPDGRLLFTLDNAEELHILDTASRTLIGSLQGLPLINDNGNPIAGGNAYGARTSMMLKGDDVWLAVAGAPPTRWTLSPDVWSRLACTLAGRSLRPSEWQQYVGTGPPADLSCRE